MALKELRMTHFLGKTVTHRFHHKNRIKGANGAGKTSIKEAICFLFTGTDSEGSRNPQHLISHDQEDCKVTIVTDKAEISRTLTKKGNGTLKLLRGDVTQTMTQAQIEQSVGSCDLFLSAFIPGYFLKLTAEKQHKIISEVSPKVDRGALIKELSGIELSSEEKLRYAIDRRVDLVANSIAQDRREYERQSAMKEGEIKQLESLKPIPTPEYPSECERIEYMESLRKQWDSYANELRVYNNSAATYERIKIENDLKDTKRKNLKERLDALKTLPEPKIDDTRSEQLAKLISLPWPAKPGLGNIIDSENCPTCGQTVGKAHREGVREKNNQMMGAYEAERERVSKANTLVDEEIKKINVAYDKQASALKSVQDENKKISKQLTDIRVELAGLVDQELPAMASEKPSAPAEEFDRDALGILQQKKKDYESSLSTSNFVANQIKEASTKIENIRSEIKNVNTAAARLSVLEMAVRQIPQEELKKLVKAFEMKTVTISVGEKIEVKKDDILYERLSTGQAFKADIEICSKLNKLMPRPINMVFLDNADLVDEIDWGDTQMFAAFVDKTVKEVQIEDVA